jgi:hypothetical protein
MVLQNRQDLVNAVQALQPRWGLERVKRFCLGVHAGIEDGGCPVSEQDVETWIVTKGWQPSYTDKDGDMWLRRCIAMRNDAKKKGGTAQSSDPLLAEFIAECGQCPADPGGEECWKAEFKEWKKARSG